MEDESGVENDRSSGVLPRELHQVFHAGVLVRREILRRVQREEPVLLQHGGDGDGSREVEERGVHGGHREVDGGSEERSDLRAGVFAAVLAGFRRRGCAD